MKLTQLNDWLTVSIDSSGIQFTALVTKLSATSAQYNGCRFNIKQRVLGSQHSDVFSHFNLRRAPIKIVQIYHLGYRLK